LFAEKQRQRKRNGILWRVQPAKVAIVYSLL
jgi:hypothetical protein